MKKFFIILLLSYFSLANSEEIKDFQINGISLGDSALDHFKLSEIKKNEINKITYPDSNYSSISLNSNNGNFDALQITYNDFDPKYKILSIAGRIIFEKKNTIACKKKMNKILNDLQNSFEDMKYVQEDTPYYYDKLGKSMTYGYVFYLKRGAIDLYCSDLSNEYMKATGHTDDLRLVLHSHEVRKYLTERFKKR
jgi:hypothetical protein